MSTLKKLIKYIFGASLIAITCSSSAQSSPQGEAQAIEKLLTAEFALARQQPLVALNSYLEAAKLSRDPNLAQAATQLAIELMLDKQAIEATKLWAELAPNNLEPQLVAITLLINFDPGSADKYMHRVLAIAPNEFSESMQVIYSQLPEQSQKLLLEKMESIVKKEPSNPHALIALAYLKIQTNEIEEVSHLTSKALDAKPDSTIAIELQAKLISHSKGSDLPAIDYLEESLSKYPKDERLRMFLSSALVDNNLYSKAKEHLNILETSEPYKGQALFLLSEIYILENNYDLAIKNLEKSTHIKEVSGKSKYMLGQIYELQGKADIAIERYLSVEDEVLQLASIMRAVNLQKSQGKYEEALDSLALANPQTLPEQKQILLLELDLLITLDNVEKAMFLVNHALKALPNDIDFLYMRSIMANKLNQPTVAENDLNKILSLNPNHANALNILGYTLSSQKERHEEALVYLNRAVKISPNNPNIMDSMGLLLFRMGQLQDSLSWLEKAYSMQPEANIALHLSEVLYALGKHKKALDVIDDAISKSPNNSELKRMKDKIYVHNRKPAVAK